MYFNLYAQALPGIGSVNVSWFRPRSLLILQYVFVYLFIYCTTVVIRHT